MVKEEVIDSVAQDDTEEGKLVEIHADDANQDAELITTLSGIEDV